MIGAGRQYEVILFMHIYVSLDFNIYFQISFGDGCHYHITSQNTDGHIVLDKTCMFTVFTERDNKPWTHSVKALQIIWNLLPQL